jgi:hypothetical protein
VEGKRMVFGLFSLLGKAWVREGLINGFYFNISNVFVIPGAIFLLLKSKEMNHKPCKSLEFGKHSIVNDKQTT